MNAKQKSWWTIALCAYGVLSLTSMALMGIGSALFLVVSLVVCFSWRAAAISELKREPWVWATFAYFSACVLSLIVAHFLPVAEGGLTGFSELKKFHFFLYPPLVALALNYSAGEIEEHPFWRFWIGMALFSAMVAISQFFARDIYPASWLGNRFFREIGMNEHFHGQGFMFFHLSFASCMCFAASAALARVYWPVGERGGRRSQRWIWLAITLVIFLGTFLSYSRTAGFALIALVAFLSFLKRPLWGFVALVTALIFAAALWQWSPTLQGRWRNNQVGNLERVRMWESAGMMFRDRPLTGVGMNRTGEYSPLYATRIFGERPQFTSHAHNNILDSLASTGVIGFLAFLAWWGVLIWGAVKVFRASAPERRWLPAAVLGGFLAFHVNGLTQINFWDGKTQHTLMLWVGIALALSLRYARELRAR